ncbi:putative Brix domain-containing ribosomal biogenesis protein [uncultured archaeon]|nr:putative Brix domain-containing ribosomal biogenesis protein [uncultured archaeon]
MYITTSRKPSDSTRVLARNISSFLNSTYENRGKKSIEDVVSRARLLGFRRVLIISESKGNPNKLSFISIAKGWDWMSPEILFSVATSQLKEKIGRIGKDAFVHAKNKDLADLFGAPEPATDDTVTVSIQNDSIAFKYEAKKLVLNIKGFLTSSPSDDDDDDDEAEDEPEGAEPSDEDDDEVG